MVAKAFFAKMRKAARTAILPIFAMIVTITLAVIYLAGSAPKSDYFLALLPALVLAFVAFAANIWAGYKTAKGVSKRLLAAGISGAAAFMIAFWLTMTVTFPVLYKLLVPAFSIRLYYAELLQYALDVNKSGIGIIVSFIVGFVFGSAGSILCRLKSARPAGKAKTAAKKNLSR